MSEELITIEINDKAIQVKPGSMLIEAADDAGIHIPRFCYHKKLSVSANCRMCLVEVERALQPMPACATSVDDGMKVWTRSKVALSAQKDNMEFLLINHPLDCPICDQGGECELQDLAVSAGGSATRFNEIKRVVVDKNIGALVSTDMTRCIQCTRCVRFGEEIAGMREMGATGRGDRMEIGTFVEKSLQSELSGNIIDICPVGALTAKPSRYKARPWEVIQTPSIASHDCVGSNISLHSFKHQLVRTVSRENEAINECWISDRDRFSYEGLAAEDRLLKPMIKQNNVWREIEWADALEAVAERINATDKDQVGALISPRATLEEQYLLQKLLRAKGVNNIDHRLRQRDFYDEDIAPLTPSLGISIAELGEQQAVLLVGSNIRQEQPMLNHRLRKAALKGATVMTVNPRAYDFNYDVAHQLLGNASGMVEQLAAIAVACGNVPAALDRIVNGIEPDEVHKKTANVLKQAGKATVLIGNIALSHPQYAVLNALCHSISKNSGANFGTLVDSANAVGAWIAGAVPHRQSSGQVLAQKGKNVSEMLRAGQKMFVLLDVEPEFDCEDPQQALSAMNQAECVVAITPFASDTLKTYADILLPASTFAETSGTFVNIEGTWQSVRGASKLLGDARPTWKILRVLGNALAVDGFDYTSSEDVRSELKQSFSAASLENDDMMRLYKKHASESGLQRISEVSMYRVDSLVRRAAALQACVDKERQVHISEQEAARRGLEEGAVVTITQGEASTVAKISMNNLIADGCIFIPNGTEISAHLGASFGVVEINTV